MYLIDPEIHGDTFARVTAAGRKIAMASVGAGVAAAAGLQLVPLYGAVIGLVATTAATASGVVAASMLLPRVRAARPSSALMRKSSSERADMSIRIEVSLASIPDSGISAVLRHAMNRMNELADRSADDLEAQQFVLMNMQSLAAIAETCSASGNLSRRGAEDVLETVRRIGQAAEGRMAGIRASAARPLEVELAVSNRLINEERNRT